VEVSKPTLIHSCTLTANSKFSKHLMLKDFPWKTLFPVMKSCLDPHDTNERVIFYDPLKTRLIHRKEDEVEVSKPKPTLSCTLTANATQGLKLLEDVSING